MEGAMSDLEHVGITGERYEIFFEPLDDLFVCEQEPLVPLAIVSRAAGGMTIHHPEKHGFSFSL